MIAGANIQPAAASLLCVRSHRRATCWLIERTDGVPFRFTDHDQRLPVRELFGKESEWIDFRFKFEASVSLLELLEC